MWLKYILLSTIPADYRVSEPISRDSHGYSENILYFFLWVVAIIGVPTVLWYLMACYPRICRVTGV